MVVVGAFVLWRETRALHWREIAPGMEFATLRGEPYCRRGSAAIAVLRLDPERVRLRVRHYTQFGAQRPLDVVEWQQRTHAVAVFNAGQFYPDYRYMGLLAGGGRWLSKRAHPGYQALLVADRREGGGGAEVIDLRSITPSATHEAGMRWLTSGKRGGAWMDDARGRKNLAGDVQTPIAYLTCNFTEPAVVDGVKKVLPALRDQLPPSVLIDVRLDRSQSIRESVRDVKLTLAATVVLVGPSKSKNSA